jgi:hypothetical protein
MSGEATNAQEGPRSDELAAELNSVMPRPRQRYPLLRSTGFNVRGKAADAAKLMPHVSLT